MWGIPAAPVHDDPAARFIPTHVGNTGRDRARERVPAVHPHACGEYDGQSDESRQFVGSSPRMWGILVVIKLHAARVRFIPTHVGNTRAKAGAPVMPSVHPHACGEYLFLGLLHGHIAGSSPRMWGIPPWLTAWMRARRFIPTHVGNTSSMSSVGMQNAVHPHACGEYYFRVLEPGSYVGSSPRMWGIQALKRLKALLKPVHPHACGEYYGDKFLCGKHGGSSPRMWGILKEISYETIYPRFIPTHVGNTTDIRRGIPR